MQFPFFIIVLSPDPLGFTVKCHILVIRFNITLLRLSDSGHGRALAYFQSLLPIYSSSPTEISHHNSYFMPFPILNRYNPSWLTLKVMARYNQWVHNIMKGDNVFKGISCLTNVIWESIIPLTSIILPPALFLAVLFFWHESE